MTNQNLLYKIGLTLAKGVGDIVAKQLLQAVDDVEILFKEKPRLLERLPGVTARLASSLQEPEVLRRAEQEINFIQKNDIQVIFFKDEAYPSRLRECIDSPILLYSKGNVNLNAVKIISIVGTRHATEYGKEVTESIVTGIANAYPETLIVSGLAYGIDIIAHRAALKENLPTIGVLAHGLDRIYPAQHRHTAIEMLEKGGLLTDFLSETNPDRQNFVRRNRIVAGMADCTLVIESAAKGGALITADLSTSYGKDVLAVPGKINSFYSRGCNNLIKENKAALVENAEDIIKCMCWEKNQKNKPSGPVQQSIFPDLNEQEELVYKLLSQNGGMQINLLAIQINIPISKLTTILFEMEMKGITICLPGGVYKIRD